MKFKSFVVLFLLIIYNGFSQESIPGGMIYCPFDPDHTYSDHIPISPEVREALIARKNSRLMEGEFADINVTYLGFTEEAQNAFQYAVDIWSVLLKSDVTINVTVDFVSFPNPNTLGGAGPGTFFRSFEGAQDTTWYPIALAEKMARRELNNSDDADIVASFSSDFDFYFGTDGNTPGNQQDFVSIVLHELGHGLGFVDLCDVNEEGLGSYGSSQIVDVYSKYIIDGSGVPMGEVENDSEAMADYLTSQDLFLNAQLATISAGDQFPKIYAPFAWSPGSSIAHLDEFTYPPGNENTLMTPQIGNGQSSHDPGPITLSLFADMGWVNSWILHEPEFSVNNYIDDIVLTASLRSDTTWFDDIPRVNYSYDEFETVSSVEMIYDQITGQYTASIPNPGEQKVMQYYFDDVSDVLGRNYRLPSSGSSNTYYSLLIGDFTLGSIPYSTDFEMDNNEFVAVNYSGTAFQRGVSEVEGKDGTTSGNNAWVTGIDETIYQNNSNSILLSPIYDFSLIGEYTLSFKSKYAFESGWDGFIVQYSTDAGKTWTKLRNEIDIDEWHNTNSVNNSIFGSFTPIFSGTTDGEFVTKTAEVSFLGGSESVWFRFQFLSDALEAEAGVVIDDFEILGPEAGPAVADFTFEGSTGCDGQTVVFTNASTGSYTEIVWDFGMNASPATAEGIGPHTVVYSGTGSSTVSLTLDSPVNGTQVNTVVDLISSSPEHTPSFDVVYNTDNARFTLTASEGDAYQWYRNGELIIGADERTLVFPITEADIYSVEVTVGSCTVATSGQTVLQFVTGLNDSSILSLYPNPSKGVLNFEADRGTASIHDLGGNLIKSVSVQTGINDIDISDLKEGMYLITRRIGGKIQRNKFIKMKE